MVWNIVFLWFVGANGRTNTCQIDADIPASLVVVVVVAQNRLRHGVGSVRLWFVSSNRRTKNMEVFVYMVDYYGPP